MQFLVSVEFGSCDCTVTEGLQYKCMFLFFPLFFAQFLCVSHANNSQGDVPLQGDFSAEHMIFGGILSHCNAHAHHLNIYHTWVPY